MKKILVPVTVVLMSLTLLSFKPSNSAEDQMVDLNNYTINVELTNSLVYAQNTGDETQLQAWLGSVLRKVWQNSCKYIVAEAISSLFGVSQYVPYSTAVEMEELGIIQSL